MENIQIVRLRYKRLLQYNVPCQRNASYTVDIITQEKF